MRFAEPGNSSQVTPISQQCYLGNKYLLRGAGRLLGGSGVKAVGGLWAEGARE